MDNPSNTPAPVSTPSETASADADEIVAAEIAADLDRHWEYERINLRDDEFRGR